ncbi:alpha/beta hydrolase [Nocardiopsis sp. N85]|uniref:alpha/beta hydrolase n=1 Tax=Nocardiopsis sp. N85 TaxID=3029400 RepID=UPI00237F8FD1|nr:alpha/beta hydrolase [Nocardiopsis sp. N85]MDE3723838.1 alpha/beta hydrolase [Nocardiopsis sp. N85]
MPGTRNTLIAAGAAVVLTAAALILLPSEENGPAAAPEPTAEERARATAERMAAADIVDVPVRFTVVNRNDSRLPCNSDGEEYTLNGHLTGPAGMLTDSDDDLAVTVYQHGQAAGEWFWRLDEPGFHHTEEMALLGRVSLTLDRLGYGAGDRPDGMSMCLGSQADMTAQVIERVREGDYTVEDSETGPDRPPAFDHVTLAGHHSGAQIAQITAYSFDGPGAPDALVLLGWSGTGLTDRANARFFGGLASCMQGGVPADAGAGPPGAEDTAPAGYAYVDVGRTSYTRANFHDPSTPVASLAAGLQDRTPCGDLGTQVEALSTDTRHLHGVEVPVLFAFADDDTRVADGADHVALFSGAPDTETVTVPDAGHYLVLEPGAADLRAALADWLEGQR